MAFDVLICLSVTIDTVIINNNVRFIVLVYEIVNLGWCPPDVEP